MIETWLAPFLTWLGLGLVPFLLLVIICVLIIRG